MATQIAKATAIRFIESKHGSMGVEVRFAFGDERISWVGWLTGPAITYSMKTLTEVLEFNGDEECNEDGMLKNQDCINRKKDVSLVIEMEEYNGKFTPKVKFINNLGGGQFSGCSPMVVKSKLAEVGFKAAFLSAKQSQGPGVDKQIPFTENDIPF